ncbi:kinase-like domain-containing protein [Xylaria venustula]|nr:kinase-like domain-containing protein [Xylaria venustula]
MATYTPIKLPYYAPAPVPLPTYEEIVTQASSEMVISNSPRHIVRVGEHFVVKFGRDVEFIEGENMLIIQRYTSLSIPILYAMYQHEASGVRVIIMEYVAGEVLSNCYDSLDASRKAAVGAQLREQLSELRNIPSPGFYGLAGSRPYLAHPWIFKNQAGPFDSANDFLKEYFDAQLSKPGEVSDPEIDDLKSQLLELSKNYDAPVFTHCDLQPQNIILRTDGSICVIDWEAASYCPEYFEFFIYRTYDMVTWGLSESEEAIVFPYADMAQLVIKAWILK